MLAKRSDNTCKERRRKRAAQLEWRGRATLVRREQAERIGQHDAGEEECCRRLVSGRQGEDEDVGLAHTNEEEGR